ncbi:MAG TPA: protein adenylyltransferase SelO family protein, partial [Abditibacterium sp.]
DMTLFFRRLCHVAGELASGRGSETALFEQLIEDTSYAAPGAQERENLHAWLHDYGRQLRQLPASADEIQTEMLSANPKYVLRNYLAQQAIESADEGDLSTLGTLFEVLKNPFDEQPEHEILAAKRPEWARDRPGCATLSCSS